MSDPFHLRAPRRLCVTVAQPAVALECVTSDTSSRSRLPCPIGAEFDITEGPSRYIFGTEFLLMSQTPALAGATVEKDCLFITDISLRSDNVQVCCGHSMDDNNVCGAITGPSCAFYRAMNGSSLQITMWNYSPTEADALSPSVIGLNGLDVDERGRVRVHAVIQEACILCICTCVADLLMNRL